MEDEVIKKYFCNFCMNNKRTNCKMNILKEEHSNCYERICKCLNYEFDKEKCPKVELVDYEIKSNKIEL